MTERKVIENRLAVIQFMKGEKAKGDLSLPQRMWLCDVEKHLLNPNGVSQLELYERSRHAATAWDTSMEQYMAALFEISRMQVENDHYKRLDEEQRKDIESYLSS